MNTKKKWRHRRPIARSQKIQWEPFIGGKTINRGLCEAIQGAATRGWGGKGKEVGGARGSTRAATHIFSYTREGARGKLGIGAPCVSPSEWKSGKNLNHLAASALCRAEQWHVSGAGVAVTGGEALRMHCCQGEGVLGGRQREGDTTKVTVTCWWLKLRSH